MASYPSNEKITMTPLLPLSLKEQPGREYDRQRRWLHLQKCSHAFLIESITAGLGDKRPSLFIILTVGIIGIRAGREWARDGDELFKQARAQEGPAKDQRLSHPTNNGFTRHCQPASQPARGGKRGLGLPSPTWGTTTVQHLLKNNHFHLTIAWLWNTCQGKSQSEG